MKRARKIETLITEDMVERVKKSIASYKVSSLSKESAPKVGVGMNSYKHVEWGVGEDIIPIRAGKRVFEVFVGFDSEYVKQPLWPVLDGDDRYHAYTSNKHVQGSRIFHELSKEERQAIEKRNKIKHKGYINKTISYQLCVFSPELDILRNEVLLVGGRNDVSLGELMGRVAGYCDDSVKAKMSSMCDVRPILRVFCVSHWSLAELQTLKDFHNIKRDFDSVRGSFITMSKPFEFHSGSQMDDDSGKGSCVDVEVILNDTCLLAPAGYQTLGALGSVIGVSKLDIEDSYKERMDLFFEKDFDRFCEYAMRDSVICLAYWLELHVMTRKTINAKLYQTVGSIAVGYFTTYLKKSGISRKDFYGKGLSNYERYATFAKNSFYGGRNESFIIGTIDDVLYDVDLSGAYSIGMARLPRLHFAEAYVTRSINDLLGVDVVGFAEVEFSFPASVLMPCLPVRTPGGLVYPRCGVSHCTSYELTLASRIGAKLNVVVGLVVPGFDDGEGVNVLKEFVRDIRMERAKHKKGTLSNNFYKLIINSLYGRFAMGVKPKKYFSSRSGVLEEGSPDGTTNVYFASLITGFIRAVLSELLHELTCRGYRVVSATTDGLLTTCSLDKILEEVNTPFVSAYKQTLMDVGGDAKGYLELKGCSKGLFSWKTRGQFSYDHSGISALAGLQKPKGEFDEVKRWFLDNVANSSVKCCNEQRRLASLQEVYKGAPFVDINYIKYISTQFDFKRKLLLNVATPKGDCVGSEPWENVRVMCSYKKKYVSTYPEKVNTPERLRSFEQYTYDIDGRRKAERARKIRLAQPLRTESLYPKALKLCVRLALLGLEGFSRKYTNREVVDFLHKHSIKDYKYGNFRCKIDSNFCKSQVRLKPCLHELALSVDVMVILMLFQKLDAGFKPAILLYNAEFIGQQPKAKVIQLERMIPESGPEWIEGYRKAVNEHKKQLSL